MTNKLALTIIVSIILTIICASLINVGIGIFLEEPKYDDFCGKLNRPFPQKIPTTNKEQIDQIACTEDAKECLDGSFVSRDPNNNCEFFPCKEDYNNEYEICQEKYDNERNKFNQIRFYILAIIGFALLITGLFTKGFYQLTGLATGGVLIFEGIIVNLENKIAVFITLLIILIFFGIFAQKIIKKFDKDKKDKKDKNKKHKKK